MSEGSHKSVCNFGTQGAFRAKYHVRGEDGKAEPPVMPKMAGSACSFVQAISEDDNSVLTLTKLKQRADKSRKKREDRFVYVFVILRQSLSL